MRAWVVFTHNHLTNLGFDAVATYDGVGFGRCAVFEPHLKASVAAGRLNDGLQPFAEVGHPCWNQFNELVKEVGSVDAILTHG